MVEIALCLAIIGFALVAIIGVLPTGLNVQRDNREETIINQDVIVWMNSIRNGSQGYDDLTNYVLAITNFWTTYEVAGNATVTNIIRGPDFDGYSREGSRVTSTNGVPAAYALTNGASIVGLLSTPKYIPNPPRPGRDGTYQSNYIVAYVRAMSGSAVEKAPQDNQTVLDSAFQYRMIVENVAYVPVDLDDFDRSVFRRLQTNSHDLRLTFRWPVLPNGDTGNGRVTFRAFTGGWLLPTNDFYVKGQRLFFFQPSTYIQSRQ